MVEEYSLPPPEGPLPQSGARVRYFKEGEYLGEIGSLEKEAFTFVGKWQVHAGQDGYGIAYRIAVKKDQIDYEGHMADFVFHFAVPIADRGLQWSEERLRYHFEKANKGMGQFTVSAHQETGKNIVSCFKNPPPQWMLDELGATLKKYF